VHAHDDKEPQRVVKQLLPKVNSKQQVTKSFQPKIEKNNQYCQSAADMSRHSTTNDVIAGLIQYAPSIVPLHENDWHNGYGHFSLDHTGMYPKCIGAVSLHTSWCTL
jgi:hypothetical protein